LKIRKFLILHQLAAECGFQVFLYGGGMHGTSLTVFETGMSQAFLASFVVTLLAAAISAMRPAHSFAAPRG